MLHLIVGSLQFLVSRLSGVQYPNNTNWENSILKSERALGRFVLLARCLPVEHESSGLEMGVYLLNKKKRDLYHFFFVASN